MQRTLSQRLVRRSPTTAASTTTPTTTAASAGATRRLWAQVAELGCKIFVERRIERDGDPITRLLARVLGRVARRGIRSTTAGGLRTVADRLERDLPVRIDVFDDHLH
ncbi:MAG: hypothetical protein ACPHIC_06555, partial [Acidimicrobiales bacterium]